MLFKAVKLFPYYLIIVAFLLLQSCMNVATTGAQAIYNRHSLEKNLSDQYITMQAYQALYHKSDQFNNTNISIATFNGEVLLAGQAPTSWQKFKAGKMVKSIPNVKDVYNCV